VNNDKISQLPTLTLLIASALGITACGGGDSIENSLRHDSQGVFRQPASLNTADSVALAEGFQTDDLSELAEQLETATLQGVALNFTPQSRLLATPKATAAVQPIPRTLTSDQVACQGGGSIWVQEDSTNTRFSKIVQYDQCITPTSQGDMTLNGRISEIQTFQAGEPGTRATNYTQEFAVTGTRDSITVLAINGSMITQAQETEVGQVQEETHSPRLEMRYGNQYWARKNYLQTSTYQIDDNDDYLQGTEQIEYTMASTRLNGFVTVTTTQLLTLDADACITQGILRYEGRNSHAELRFGDATGTAAYATLELSNGTSSEFTDCAAVKSWMNRNN
jgi:hypothetical protein